jgi:hypothetical protein
MKLSILHEMAMPTAGKEKCLSPQQAQQLVLRGWSYAVRDDSYTPATLRIGNRGTYYYIGDPEDKRIELGSCLLVNNKVHAAVALGLDQETILDKLNYWGDGTDADYTPEQFLDLFIQGKASHRTYDQFDRLIAEAARKAGYDTILLVREPHTHSGRGFATELVDIRNVKPK